MRIAAYNENFSDKLCILFLSLIICVPAVHLELDCDDKQNLRQSCHSTHL